MRVMGGTSMRRKLSFLSLLVMIALVSAGCFDFLSGPVTVSGIVTVNGELPGDDYNITVSVKERSESTKVNADGTFSLQLKPGSYTLVASGEGLKIAEVAVSVKRNTPVSGLKIEMEVITDDKYYLVFDPLNEEHLALIKKPWDSIEWEIKADWFGDPNLYFPRGQASYAPPAGTYDQMRFVYFDTPDLDTFRISIEQLGDGPVTSTAPGGNRSLAFIFGYQDLNNWWVAYYTYTNATRVARIVDGKQEYVCRPLVEGQWWPNNDKYQLAEIAVVRDGDKYVLRSYANGEPTSIDLGEWSAEDYTPGKVGLGGHSTSDVQAWWFRNIIIEEL